MQKITLIIILCALNIGFINAKNKPKSSIANKKHNVEYLKKQNLDTCVLSGFNFRIIDQKSNRELRAIIQNNYIKIVTESGQIFDYRIVQYIFSSYDNDEIPVVRTMGQRVDYRIINMLKQSQLGDRYKFEDIVFIDGAGKKLKDKVRSIFIERIE